jgi:Zn-dependent metalloprotease
MARLASLVLAASICAAADAQSTNESPALPGALTRWRAENGGGWRVDIDDGTGYAELLYGASRAAEFEPRDEREWFALARLALERTGELHGIEPQTLVEHGVQDLPLPWTTDKTTVRFHQSVGGVPVEGGFVNVLFDRRGTLLSVQTRALPRVASLDLAPAIDAQAAAELAIGAFLREEGVPGSIAAEPRLAVLQLEEEEARVPRLAWQVDVRWLPADADPLGLLVSIDARSGAVVHREPSIHFLEPVKLDVGGTLSTKASPGTAPDTAAHPETQQVMKYARVTSAAGTVFTDASGHFLFPGVVGPLSCTFAYVGSFADVANEAGAEATLVQSLAGTANQVVMNATGAAAVTAQANAFLGVNRVRDFVRSVNPTDSKADFVRSAYVNLGSTCNAYFDGSSIRFFAAGGGCVNSAYSTVVAHEDGHWLNARYGTGNGPDGMGEGNADVFAMYVHDDPIVGRDFCGSGCPIRSGENATPFCGDCCAGCQGEVHANGEPWMGAAWKIRRNLGATHGDAAGDAIANALFLGWMNSFNQTQIKSVIELQWLTLDDDDGTLDNGTPNHSPIDAAFREQGFPGFVPAPIAFSGVTQLPNTTNPIGPYAVGATLASNLALPIVSATVRYASASAGPFQSVAMTATGGSWSGAIPGHVAPRKLYYYVEAVDAAGNAGRYPPQAPAETLHFAVGALQQIACESFDAPSGWTVASSSIAFGGWVRGDPIGTVHNGAQAQPEVDDPAGSGTQCFFTGQGLAGGSAGDSDLDGGPTVLTSPAYDLSVGNGEISYSYWTFNDDGDDRLVVQLSSGGGPWVTARIHQGGNGHWKSASLDIGSFVVPSASVRVRFQAADQPNDSVTEAAVDSVCVSVFGPVVCDGDVETYCTAKSSSAQCVPAIAASGTPSASSSLPFAISASQVHGQTSGMLFYGHARAAQPFLGGTLCCQPPVRRTPVQPTGGSSAACSGVLAFDFNARIRSGADPELVAGRSCAAQVYFRDPGDSFAAGLSDAVSFTICP